MNEFITKFLSYHRGRYNSWKLGLRLSSLVHCFFLIVLSLVDNAEYLKWASWHPRHMYYNLPASYYYCVPIGVVGIFIDAGELALTWFWQRNPGAHPGWHIGAEIVTLGTNIFALIYLSIAVNETFPWAIWLDPPVPLRGLRITLIIFLGIYTIQRAALFVFAGIDTHRHVINVQIERVAQFLRLQNHQDESYDDTYNRVYQYFGKQVPKQTALDSNANTSLQSASQRSLSAEPAQKVLGNLSDLQAEELSSGFKMRPSDFKLMSSRGIPE